MSVGGGATGGQSESKYSKRYHDLSPASYRLLQAPLANALTPYTTQGLGAVPNYDGPLTAQMSPAESQLLEQITGSAGSNPFSAPSSNLINANLRGDFLRPDSNPHLAAYVEAAQRPVIQGFEDARMGDRAAFTNAGHRIQGASSPFAHARALAERGLADSLGDISTKTYTAAYEGDRARQENAQGQALQFNQANLESLMKGLDAAALPRLIAENGIDRGLDVYKERLAMLQNMLGLTAQVANPRLQNVGGTTKEMHVDASGSASYGG